MTSQQQIRRCRAKIAELEAENMRLKKGEVFLQLIKDGNSFAYSAPQKGGDR
jgi:hypothetical protein